MSERVRSSEERRVALEQVSRMISERVERARVQRGDVSVESCEDHQAMQVAIELQCRLTEMESIATRGLDRASKYMDRITKDKCLLCAGEAIVSFTDLDTGVLAEYCQEHAPTVVSSEARAENAMRIYPADKVAKVFNVGVLDEIQR